MKRVIFFILLMCAILKVNAQAPIKGVWLTNVASKVLDSRSNIVEAVELCKKSGINTIFLVTWNRGNTLYPSKVMKKKFGVEIDSRFKGRDPLQEMIEEAHKRNIKVHAWFEFGFSSSFKDNGGNIIAKHPEWAALNAEGKLVSKNNFEWMNAFLPEVQHFMNKLILEVVKKYDVDGIQGDDRLPAQPSTAGYDKYTVGAYKKEHGGKAPPTNYKDTEWLSWRANRLNLYLKDLYHMVKKEKPNMLVTMAPSIFPWSKEEYLQDWPTWLKEGYVDYVFPQIYRYDIQKYKATLEASLKYVPEGKKSCFYPGLLLKVDNYTPERRFLEEMVKANRENGIKGEVFFFYEGLKLHPEYFKTYGTKN
ncbi:family 10 glycosylhydrolase [Pedobacter petrophilus]|uniref:Family 10 glycosylhydrolase n=1 Tax=Pedobacter petrophilus TaxID=1908241 RepID=A0A7K0FTZ4_9SPHI|nr:family 10 glycosylhydrolase [Pedobacter petrophilus]MRX74700.1 family 10 glycosylhydrolase [Pedobacter petrophilus]